MFAKIRFLKSLDFFVLEKFKIKKLKINFKFQYLQIKPSFTTLYKRRHIPGFVATGHIYYSVCTLNSICTKSIYSRICILEYKEYILQDLYTKLYPHQKEGLLWFWGLHKKRTGGILADDMG